MDGTYVSFSEPAPFQIWRKRPDLYRFDSTRINKFVVHAYDGKNAWWINPLFGPEFEKPQIIPAEGNLDKVTLADGSVEHYVNPDIDPAVFVMPSSDEK